MIRLVAGSVVAGILGAICGVLALYAVGLLSSQLHGESALGDMLSAHSPDLWLGTCFGAPIAIAAYVLFFSPFPAFAVARQVPVLFAFTLLGALPGPWLSYGIFFTIVPAFLVGCVFSARRLVRETGIQGHPFQ